MAKLGRKSVRVDDWVEEIAEGLRYRRTFGLEHRWHDYEKLFYNTAELVPNPGPNIVQMNIDRLLSDMCVPYPQFVVKPRSIRDVDKARILQAVDNDLVEDMDLKQEMEYATLHCALWGKGYLKIGYDSEWGWDPEVALQLASGYGMTMSQFDSYMDRIEYDSRVRPGMPWVRACLPHDVVFPWGVLTAENTPWFAHRVVRHIDDLRRDEKYNVRGLEPCLSIEDFVKSYQSPFAPFRGGARVMTHRATGEGKPEFVEFYEIHCWMTGRIVAITLDHDKFLRNDVDLLQINGLPIVDFSFIPRARSIWTTPDVCYMEAQQAELSDIALQTSKQRRVQLVRFLGLKGALDMSEIQKALGPDVGPYISVNDGYKLNEAFMPIMPQNLSQSLYTDAEYVRRNARESIGYSRNEFGEFEQSGRRTATEASIVRQGSMIRATRRQGVIRDAYQSVIKKVNHLIFRYWTLPRWVQIVGGEGAEKWVAVSGTELMGDYRYHVFMSSEPPMTKQDKRKEALMMYQLLSQDPNIDRSALLAYLSEAFDDPDLKNLAQRSQANADVRGQVQAMLSGMGGVPASEGAPGAAAM